MAAQRQTPTLASEGGLIGDNEYATRVKEEVSALWQRSIDTLASVAGTNTITAMAGATLIAYGAGVSFWLTPANTNTGAVTLNVDGLGARNVRDRAGVALPAGALVAGTRYLLVDDGTQFRVAVHDGDLTNGNWVPQGAWLSVTNYEPLDVVTNDGVTYIAIAANVNDEPPSANWVVLVEAFVGGTLTQKLNASPSAVGGAGFNIGNGSTPGAPVQGDMWGGGNSLLMQGAAGSLDVCWTNFPQTFSQAKTFPNTGLRVLDTNASHSMGLVCGSNITANRDVTLVPGDANRQITLNGDVVLPAGTVAKIADVQDFTGSGTWNKPANALWVDVIAVGAGGGGGGGGRVASGNAASGGGGGGGGQRRVARFKASDLGSSETVTINAAGTGANGSTSNGVAGSDGTAGGNVTFGSKVTAYGGGGGAGGEPGGNSGGGGGAGALGAGGSSTDATAGTAGLIGGAAGGSGGAGGSNVNEGCGSGGGGGTNGAVGGAGNHTLSGPCGGGAGGGVAAGPTAFAGGAGGRTSEYAAAAAGGGNTGVAGATPAASQLGAGAGAGGGGGNPSGVGGAGGVGGSYGGGGGGGGAAVGANGGAGGNGGGGFVRVVSYF